MPCNTGMLNAAKGDGSVGPQTYDFLRFLVCYVEDNGLLVTTGAPLSACLAESVNAAASQSSNQAGMLYTFLRSFVCQLPGVASTVGASCLADRLNAAVPEMTTHEPGLAHFLRSLVCFLPPVPGDVPGLLVQLDAAVPINEGPTEFGWPNQADTDFLPFVLEGGTGGNPTLIPNSPAFNNRPVLRFNGLKSMFGAYLVPSVQDQPTTIFVVAMSTNLPGGTESIVDGILVGARNDIFITAANTGYNAGAAQSAASTILVPALLMGIFDAGTSLLQKNGTTVTAAAPGGNSMTGLRVGSRYDGTAEFFDGDIAEILIYNGHLTASQIAAVEEYVRVKYALAIPF